MRGTDDRTAVLSSYVRLEGRITADRPLRAICCLVEEVQERFSGRLAGLHSRTGRPSAPPDQLLKGTLLRAFFTVRSERKLMEQIEYDLCSAGSSGWRWTPGCGMLRPFPRTATVCSRPMSLASFSPR